MAALIHEIKSYEVYLQPPFHNISMSFSIMRVGVYGSFGI